MNDYNKQRQIEPITFAQMAIDTMLYIGCLLMIGLVLLVL